jgi:2-octaprenyl-6-methoxyphenol hydroxylase
MHTEVVVVGGGPTGLMVAVALATAGVQTVLVSKRPPQPDNRTTALLTGSVIALNALGVWAHCRDRAAPLRAIRLIDDTPRLLRAPEVLFEASEIGLDAFGHNIENRHLVAALDHRAGSLTHLERIDDEATHIEIGARSVEITLAGGLKISAALAIGADGRKSACRAAARIATSERSYPQAAITLNLGHGRPHHGVSTEFHTPAGPLTLVPLNGGRSSLVCVVEPSEADRLSLLDDAALAEAVERRAHSALGKVTIEPGRGLFRLSVVTAQCIGANRIALVGEAAHVLPPIGAQGLNLGLRDAAMISELVVSAHKLDRDVGGSELLARYDEARRADVISRTLAVDLLNRSLLSDFLPLQGIRGLGLYLLDRIGPLRRAIMREGVTPALSEPRLMRGEALS